MRILLVVLGAAAIVAYAVLGAMLMNNWVIVAASGLPFDDAIAEMRAADESFSPVPGFVFAAMGLLLTLAWATLALSRRVALSTWLTLAIWAGILAFGAPAYFIGSFGNLMSVGDTFFEWYPDAAFVLEAPFYATSGVAAVIAITAVVVDIARVIRRGRAPVAQP